MRLSNRYSAFPFVSSEEIIINIDEATWIRANKAPVMMIFNAGFLILNRRNSAFLKISSSYNGPIMAIKGIMAHFEKLFSNINNSSD